MLNDLKKHYPSTILMLIVLIWGSIYLFADSMHEYPSYVHAWTQTDRLALAQNFQENGFDFFHPSTYNLLTKAGITQVDFPIHDYLVAIVGKVLNADLVYTFRLYNLLYSLIGLFFFFRLGLLITKSDRRAVWATSFLFTLPVYVYYQNGFLPSIPSIANFFIALYALMRYHQSQKIKHFILACSFMTLAALCRSPFFIFLFALLLQRTVLFYRAKKVIWSELWTLLIGMGLFWGYFIYNQMLAEQYGSMFLTKLLYFNDFESFKTVLATAFDRFGDEILSPYQAVLFLSLLIAIVYQLNESKQIRPKWSALSLYFLISLLGVIAFFLLMGKQFADHDYYYVDTLYPLVAMLLLLSLSKLKIPRSWYTPVAVVCLVFFFYFFSYAKAIQEERYTPPYNDRIEYAYQVYKNAQDELKDWGIEEGDTLLVLDAVTTNMPFTLWGNRGYTILNSGEESVKAALDTLAFNYVILLDSNFVSDSYKDYPEIIRRLELLHHNGTLGVYRKSSNKGVADFFEHFRYFAADDFDGQSTLDSASLAWAKIEAVDSTYGKSLFMPFNYEYALSVKKVLPNLSLDKPLEVMVLADYYPLGDTAQIQLVCAHGDYYKAEYLQNFVTQVDEWQRRLFRFQIPANQLSPAENVGVYFWNPNQDNLYIDNYKIVMYQ